MNLIVKYTTTRINSQKHYKLEEIVNCCEKMTEAIKENAIGFGEIFESTNNIVAKMCIYKCIPYPEGAVYYEFEIDFCPFCGLKIKLKEIKNEQKQNTKKRRAFKNK